MTGFLLPYLDTTGDHHWYLSVITQQAHLYFFVIYNLSSEVTVILIETLYTNKKLNQVIGKLPERGSESEFNWFLTEDTKDELTESTDVQVQTFVPKIVDPVYRNY